MTTLNATYARRAMTRLTRPASLPELELARPGRYAWLRLALPFPAAADSRLERAVLSTSARPEWLRVLDIAGLVAAATGAVALLAAVCR